MNFTTLRKGGYDPNEVRIHLESVAREVGHLEARIRELQDQLSEAQRRADAAAGVMKGRDGTPGLICRHPCGGGDEPISGVYYGRMPGAIGYRLCGVNCIFEGAVLTASESVSPRTLLELLTVAPEKSTSDNREKKAK